MRALPACLLLLLPLLAACQSEPSFDERYAETERQISDKAEELDSELKDAAPMETPASEDADAG